MWLLQYMVFMWFIVHVLHMIYMDIHGFICGFVTILLGVPHFPDHDWHISPFYPINVVGKTIINHPFGKEWCNKPPLKLVMGDNWGMVYDIVLPTSNGFYMQFHLAFISPVWTMLTICF